MKKFLLIAILSLFCFSSQAQIQTSNKNWILPVFNDYPISSATGTVIIPFYPNENVAKIGMQVDYKQLTGDSAHVNVYVSANGTTWSPVVSNYKNTRWISGAGGTKTFFDNIDVSAYPVAYLKIFIDTCTSITGGKVSVYIKPYFK